MNSTLRRIKARSNGKPSWSPRRAIMRDAPRELFPFRYRNPLTGKWVKARYRAEQHEIAQRFAEFEIIGPPETREVDPGARSFALHKTEAPSSIQNLGEMLLPIRKEPLQVSDLPDRHDATPH